MFHIVLGLATPMGFADQIVFLFILWFACRLPILKQNWEIDSQMVFAEWLTKGKDNVPEFWEWFLQNLGVI
jgi:hypothetical protein